MDWHGSFALGIQLCSPLRNDVRARPSTKAMPERTRGACGLRWRRDFADLTGAGEAKSRHTISPEQEGDRRGKDRNVCDAQRDDIYEAAVVGSIIFFTSVIFVAGKPLISACLLIMASSFAR